MSYIYYSFDLKEHLSLKESPNEYIIEWLNTKAILKANKKTGKTSWLVDSTWLEKKNNDYSYVVRLKRQL